MSADESNVANPVRVIDRDNQTVLVPPDVEHDSVLSDDACVRVDPLHVRRRAPIGLTNVVIPSPQRLLRVGVALPELTQSPPCNDPHRDSV